MKTEVNESLLVAIDRLEEKITVLAKSLKDESCLNLEQEMKCAAQNIRVNLQKGFSKNFNDAARRSFQKSLGFILELEFLIAFSDYGFDVSDEDWNSLDRMLADIKSDVWSVCQSL